MAKPYSTSHIGFVSSGFTDMRLSGAVKEQLVEMLVAEIDQMVPAMEAATLSATPDKKTLDDTNRTRLNYNRTRELMIERLGELESVGSEAVQAGIEHLETYLKKVLHAAESAAAKDRVNTIKPRHLSAVTVAPAEQKEGLMSVNDQAEDDELEGTFTGSVLTPNIIRKMARGFAGMPVTDLAIRELHEWYFEVVHTVAEDIRSHAQLGSNPAAFIDAIDKMKHLMGLSWMRKMLVRAGENSEERGYKRIDVEQLIHLDPFE